MKVSAILGALLLAVTVAACGGGETSDATTAAFKDEGLYRGPRTPNASKEFIVPGGDNSIPTYGQEASAAERESASIALEAYLTAREAEDWKTACEYIAHETLKSLKETQADADSCQARLAAIAAETPASSRVDTLGEPIVGLRIEDKGRKKAFALYHGSDGVAYAMPMYRTESPRHYGWQVNALEPRPLPQ